MKSRMHLSEVLVCLSIIFPVLTWASALDSVPQTPPAADNGTSTGQRIGNVISAAVSTAFPQVKNILDAIWPNRGANKEDKKKADAADPSLQAKKAEADKQQATNMRDLVQAAKNLGVLRSFITTCGNADVTIAAMHASIAEKSATDTLSDKEKQDLHYLWDPVSTDLDKLTNDSVTKDIQGINDVFLKATLDAIQRSIHKYAGNVTKQIDQGRISALRGSLDQLSPQMSGVAPLAAVLIGDLSSSVSQAATNISAGAGVEEDKMAAGDRAANLTLLNKLYSVEE